MNAFFKKKVFTPAAALFIAVVISLAALAAAGVLCRGGEGSLYEQAVKDAMTIESDEFFPLVTLEQGSPEAVFSAEGKVLLVTWHRYPQSYPAGEEVTLSYGEVWTFTEREMEDWYSAERGVKDWNLRLKQLLGLPESGEYTHFTALWADPEDILRPAYTYSVTERGAQTAFPEGAEEDFIEWFNGNILYSYFDSAYPWTRLGYTYDWAAGCDEYGLTEFIIKKGSPATVEFTVTTEEFLASLGD